MAAPKTKTAVMAMMGRKPAIIRQFGSIAGFRRAAHLWLDGIVPQSNDTLTRIIDNQPCTPAQATAVEKAIFVLMDRPKTILDGFAGEYTNEGKMTFDLSVGDMLCLRAALRLDEEETDEK